MDSLPKLKYLTGGALGGSFMTMNSLSKLIILGGPSSW